MNIPDKKLPFFGVLSWFASYRSVGFSLALFIPTAFLAHHYNDEVQSLIHGFGIPETSMLVILTAAVVILAQILTIRKSRSAQTRYANQEARQSLLLQSLADQQQAVDQTVGITVTDRNGIILYANDVYCRLLGYTQNELIGKPHSFHKSGIHSAVFFQELWNTILAGKIWKGEVSNRAKDGRLVWMDSTILPILDIDGNPYQFKSLRFDVTAKRELEAAIMATHQGDLVQAHLSPTFCYRFLHDDSQTVTFLNEHFESTTGFSASEFLGQPVDRLLGLVHPDDRSRVREIHKSSLTDELRWRVHYRVTRRDGATRFLLEQGLAKCGPDGKALYYDGLVQDVTDSSRADISNRFLVEMMRQSESLSRLASWSLNMETYEAVWPKQFLTLFDLDPGSEVPSLDYYLSLTHPEDRVPVLEFVSQCLRTGSGGLCHRFKNQKGRVFYVEIMVTKMKNAGTGIDHLLVTTLDISELVQNHGSLKTQSIFLNEILQNLPVGVLVHDSKKNLGVVLSNSFAEGILHRGSPLLQNQSALALWPEGLGDEIYRMQQEALNRHRTTVRETVPVEINDHRRILNFFHLPLRDNQSHWRYVVTIVEDYTARFEADMIIQRQHAQITSSAKLAAVGEMAGSIAHEINNPLGIIQSNCELVLDLIQEQPPNSDQLSKAALAISTTTERIAKIVRGLRSLSRDSSSDPFELVPLRQILEDALSLCAEKFKASAIDLVLVNQVPDVLIQARPTQIAQVILNLLNNAFDAIQPEAKKWIRVEVTSKSDQVELSFTDCGRGIPEEVRSRIFSPFYTTKPSGKGTGLGLSISKGIMDLHRGTIEIDSASAFTRFLVRLPIATLKKEPLE